VLPELNDYEVGLLGLASVFIFFARFFGAHGAFDPSLERGVWKRPSPRAVQLHAAGNRRDEHDGTESRRSVAFVR
jgi:hypothetical protein